MITDEQEASIIDLMNSCIRDVVPSSSELASIKGGLTLLRDLALQYKESRDYWRYAYKMEIDNA